MRQIGTLPETDDPQVFGDYLLSLGVSSRAVRSPEGWAVWVHNEDHVAKARDELDAYRQNPGDPRYHVDARAAAEEVRREKDRLDREYRKNVRHVSGGWDRVNFRRRPLTASLVLVCVALYLAGNSSDQANFWLLDRLMFFSFQTLRGGLDPLRGLDDILVRKEVWRLVTPAFLHGGLLHLVLNSWVVFQAGTLIETRRGTRLFQLVLLSAVVSNLGQFLLVSVYDRKLVPWVGISGVAFALFGYIWMKGQNEPEQGMALPPTSVRLLLLWLVLGFANLVPGVHMANGAHLAGLVAGMLFGLARF